MSTSRPSLVAILAVLTITAISNANLVAQSGSATVFQIDVGAMKAFGHTGPYLAVVPLALELPLGSSSAAKLRVGIVAQFARIATDLNRRPRTLLAIGPAVALEIRPVDSPIAIWLQADLDWMRSTVTDPPSVGVGPPVPATSRAGSANGIGMGAGAGIEYRITEDVGIRVGAGYLHHAIYPDHPGHLWKFGTGVVLGG